MKQKESAKKTTVPGTNGVWHRAPFILRISIWIILGAVILLLANYQLRSYQHQQELQIQVHQIQQHQQQQIQLIKTNQMTLAYVLRLVSKNRIYWTVEEVTSMIRFADFAIYQEGDILKTLHLLQMAKDRLRRAKDHELRLTRRLLNQTIKKLQQLQVVNTEDLYQQLTTLSYQILQMPYLTERMHYSKKLKQITDKTKHHQKGWKKTLEKSWNLIGQAFVIKHHKVPVDPLLTKTQHISLSLNLSALVAQAQLALLQKDQAIYAASLGQAKDLIQRYYIQTNLHTRMVVKTLDALKKIRIKTTNEEIHKDLQNILLQLKTVSTH